MEGEGFVWIGDGLKSIADARISPFDHGLLTGDGVFETMIVYNGSPFAATRHWRRLKRSADAIGIVLPSRDMVDRAMRQVIEANGCQSGRLRLTVTAGLAPLGSDRGNASSTLIVAVADIPEMPPTAHLITVPFRRNEFGALATHKTTSYGENVVALAYAKKHGGTEAIFANTAGMLCEGASTNIFLMLDGKLITPPLASGCLPGVTRALVLELCQTEGISVEEREVPLTSLEDATEAFVTSSIRELQPVARVNGNDLPHCPGEVTERLKYAFKELTRRVIDPQ